VQTLQLTVEIPPGIGEGLSLEETDNGDGGFALNAFYPDELSRGCAGDRTGVAKIVNQCAKTTGADSGYAGEEKQIWN
jgi:hypothetical protein